MSISRYMVALLDAPPIRSGKRGYMDCGFPAAFVSRVILRSVRQARTASWQFSRLPRRPYSDRPEPPTRLLTHNRCPLLIVIYGLRGRLACSPDPSLRCTWVYRCSLALYTLLAALSTDLQGSANDPETRRSQSREEIGTFRARIYNTFNTCWFYRPRCSFGVYVVKNINLQYKPPQKMRSCRWLVRLACRVTMADSWFGIS